MKKRKAGEISTTKYESKGGPRGGPGDPYTPKKKGTEKMMGGKKPNLNKLIVGEGNKKVDKVIGGAAGSAHRKINDLSDKYGGSLSKPLKGALVGSAHELVNAGAKSGKDFIKKEGKNVFNSAVHHIKEGGRKAGEKISDLWGRAKKRLKIG